VPPVKELTGVVSIDLRNEPTFPFDPNAAAAIAVGLNVDSEETYVIAARMIQESAACIAKVEEFFEEDKSLAYRLHKSITEKVAKFTMSWRTVRPTLEPRMKKFRQEQERIRLEEERRLARQAEEARLKAEAEAAEVRRKAEEEAAALRRQGEMRAAREVVAGATEQAQQVVDTANALEEIGTIAPSPPKLAAVGESRPWVAEIVDSRKLLRAIADDDLLLSQEDMDKLKAVLQPILNRIAKRMGKEDLGFAGARGVRDVQLRFSKSPVQAAAPEGDGW
jgi:hypothetical protein